MDIICGRITHQIMTTDFLSAKTVLKGLRDATTQAMREEMQILL